MKPTCCRGIPFEALDSQMRSLLTLSGKQADAMAATRKVVELPIEERELAKLQSIARSRTRGPHPEPRGARPDRATIIGMTTSAAIAVGPRRWCDAPDGPALPGTGKQVRGHGCSRRGSGHHLAPGVGWLGGTPDRRCAVRLGGETGAMRCIECDAADVSGTT